MAGIPKVKIQFDADLDGLKKGTAQADTEIGGFADRVSDFGKKAAAAFALAGAAVAAYAGKLLVDGVKSAIEDEAAQAKLAGTLERVAGASKETVKAVESYITQTALATGVADDKLRPALDRLVRSTGDAGKAQDALNLALNISAATGKSLETVTAAVGKALDGNATALGKVAGGFEASELKGKSFSDLLPELTERFGGAAQAQAETFAGKVARLGVAFDEAKETVGSFVLDAITPLFTKFVDVGIPAISQFAEEIGTKLQPIIESVGTVFKDVILPALQSFWSYLTEIVIPAISAVVIPIFQGLQSAFDKIATAVKDNKDEFEKLKPVLETFGNFVKNTLAPILGGAFKTGLSAIGTIVSTLVTGFAKLAGFIGDAFDALTKFINLIKNNPVVKGISNVVSGLFGGGKAAGGPVTAGTSYIVGERGPEMFVPQTNGTIIPNNRLGGGIVNNYNINVSGAIDAESTARQIITLLNDSQARGTRGAGAFAT